jgi:hypothetical protein
MYVRKYDPPMLVGTAEFSSVQMEMADILSKNMDGPGDLTNESIMASIKENIQDHGGFVDVLSLYNKK